MDEAAKVWDENGRPEGSLWRPPDLDFLGKYHERSSDNMTPLQVDFFEASVALRDREQNQRQRRRKLTFWGLVAVVVLALVFSGVTLALLRNAKQAQKETEDLKNQAESEVNKTKLFIKEACKKMHPAGLPVIVRDPETGESASCSDYIRCRYHMGSTYCTDLESGEEERLSH